MWRVQRDHLLRQVRAALAGRNLVYFGTRGEDVECVADLPELSAAYCVVGASRRRTSVRSVALEDLTSYRVDLDAHDIDDDLATPEVGELRRAMLRSLSNPSVLFTYRPSTFLSAICFARADKVEYAGMFKDHQSAFEHKPWVESSVRALQVPAIPWTYVADEDQLDSLPFLDDGPVMLRRSRSSGGTGLTKVSCRTELEAAWPRETESFVSVAPFIPDGISTNVSAVVWRDGVTVHPASVQLIGTPGLTIRPFGYCGNDFGAARELDPRHLEIMDASTSRVGEWLRTRGYLGAFGVDFLIADDAVLFTEINPRLQGVTHLASQLAIGQGLSCVMLEHLAAQLGLPSTPSRSLREQVSDSPDLAHLVMHRLPEFQEMIDGHDLADVLFTWDEVRRLDVEPTAGLTLAPGATIGRVTVEGRLTQNGTDLLAPWAARLHTITETMCKGMGWDEVQ